MDKQVRGGEVRVVFKFSPDLQVEAAWPLGNCAAKSRAKRLPHTAWGQPRPGTDSGDKAGYPGVMSDCTASENDSMVLSFPV